MHKIELKKHRTIIERCLIENLSLLFSHTERRTKIAQLFVLVNYKIKNLNKFIYAYIIRCAHVEVTIKNLLTVTTLQNFHI